MTETQNPPTGIFLYGIVPSDVEPVADAEGIGSRRITAVRQNDIAALVSEIDLAEPIGHPADLNAYQGLLDATATVAPVLPIRFGTVVTTEDEVAEWLKERHDLFAATLAEFEGRVQYTVHGRFDEDAFIGRLLAEDATAKALADQIQGTSEVESRQQRIQLGEMIARAVEAQQQQASQDLAEALGDYAVASAPRPPSHEMDAVNIAWLVEAEKQDDFVQAVEEFAEQRRDLIRTRLFGPLAPYDFVAQQPME
jgi:hypothetical protein